MVLLDATSPAQLRSTLAMKAAVHLILLLTAACLFGCASDRDVGRADARRDLARGVLQLHDLGGRHDSYLDEDYWPLLKNRYGIRVIDHGCLIDERTLQRAQGYDEVMDAELARRFGTNFWQPVLEEARGNYALRHPSTK